MGSGTLLYPKWALLVVWPDVPRQILDSMPYENYIMQLLGPVVFLKAWSETTDEEDLLVAQLYEKTSGFC